MSKVRCPACGSKKVEKYDNQGSDEYICKVCLNQWQYDVKGVARLL